MTREDVLDMADDPDYAGNPSLIRQLAGQCYDAGLVSASAVEWHKITDADSLPEQNKVYWCYRGKIDLLSFDPESEQAVRNFIKHCTHWAEIVEPEPPEEDCKV